MTAPVVISLEDRFRPATEAVNAWRGRCLASFARAERAVSEALWALGGAAGKTALPLLVGLRYAALAARLEERGDLPDALVALRAFGAHDDLRIFLCHGDSRITLDRSGRWLTTFTLVCGRGDGVERRFLLVEDDDATSLIKVLDRDRRRLVSVLERTVLSITEKKPEEAVPLRTGAIAA